MSHWHSSKDYEWVEENLPKLTELDLSDLQDTMVCGDDFFEGSYPTTDSQGELSWKSQDLKTYEQLRSHKTLLGRLEKLWVRHWGCERLHDWKYRHARSSDGLERDELANAEIRSRREAGDFGQSSFDVTSVISECSKLRTLAIRGPSLNPALSSLWRPHQACAEDEGSHAHFCAVVKGLEDNAPETLRAIEFYQAEFAPRMVEMLRGRTNIRRFSVSFGDVLRRFAPGREPDVSRDDPNQPTAGYTNVGAFSANDKAICKYQTKLGKAKKGEFHGVLNVEVFPPERTTQQLRNEEIKGYLHQWAKSQLQAAEQIEPDHVLSGKSALIAEYLLTNRHQSPVPGLNDFLLQLTDAFNHCDNFSFNDQEVINEIPVSPFSFIGPSSQSSSPGIFGDAANDEAIQAFRLLHQGFGWAPLWDLDPLLDAHNFPWNVGIEIAAPEGEGDDDDEDGRRATTTTRRLVAPILNALRTLSHAGVPVRLLLGNRPRSPFLSNAGLYWGATAAGHPADVGDHTSWLTLPVDDADLVRHGGGIDTTTTTTAAAAETQRPQKEDEQRLTLDAAAGAAAAAAANGPDNIAACADELVIRYQDWVGHHHLLLLPPTTKADKEEKKELSSLHHHHHRRAMLTREARGWQAWWRGAALRFTRLRRLRVAVAEAEEEEVGLSELEGNRLLWREVVRELGLLGVAAVVEGEGETTLVKATPDDDDVDEPPPPTPPTASVDLRVPETQASVLTPPSTPPPVAPAIIEEAQPPSLEERELLLVSEDTHQSEIATEPEPEPESEPSSKPKRPRKGKATPKKPSSATNKRKRSDKGKEPETKEASLPPPPKKAKGGKKTRWERELERLQS
ncbi:hypothetical protein SLS58_010812 [Diplodia intermedia]|uniref:Uncharacterized protein n=1 Tax=Diplodia intermedia TaxID=856260 RepID=A0ABR3T3D3_9PEZI